MKDHAKENMVIHIGKKKKKWYTLRSLYGCEHEHEVIHFKSMNNCTKDIYSHA